MATGNVVGAVVWVGSVHVDPEVHAATGYPVAVIEVVLPSVENVPAAASVTGPVAVNVVAATVTCQPADDPVASTTAYNWSAGIVSTTFRSAPVTVAVQVRVPGVVRFSVPAVRARVPVTAQA